MSADEITPKYARSDDAYATRRLRVAPAISQPVDRPIHDPLPAPEQTSTRRPPSFKGWLLNLLVLLVVALLVAIPSALYYLDRSYEGKIYPNVRITGVQVGEMTPDQADAAVRAKYGAFLDQPITLTYNDQTWQPSAKELGVRFDFQAAVESAYRSGRGQGLVGDLQSVAAIWQNGLDVPLRATIDQRAVLQYVQQISAELEQAPVDATLTLSGLDIQVTPMQVGRQVDVDQTVREMTEALGQFEPQSLVVRTRELQPRLNDAAAEDARARIAAFINGPLTLTVDAKQYVWQPSEIALMLNIARVPENSASDRIDVAINQLQVERRLRKITDETGRGSVNPRVAWNNGNLTITKPGETGLRLDQAGAQAAILNWNGAERSLALPVNVVQPQVTEANLNTLGIKELVSVGRSDFSGSADYRIQNIGAGMKKFNGILLAPGEEFSFNENVGSIDAANGFVEGYAIIQNRTQLEFGGGICQDSTTMFRAAFWAGLPITERWGHSFYISWYDKYALGPLGDGPGMDATIFTGGPDLKFVNDTGNWLLIESESNPQTAIAEVRFYGTKLDRTVSMTQEVTERKPAIEKPQFIGDKKQARGTYKRTDTKRGGMTIKVYRTITENGVTGKPQLFQTVFQPWADKYALNPADIGANGRPLIPGPWSGNAPKPQAQPQPAPAPVTPDPNVQSAPAPVDPNAQPAPAPVDPNAQPAPEQQVPAPQG